VPFRAAGPPGGVADRGGVDAVAGAPAEASRTPAIGMLAAAAVTVGTAFGDGVLPSGWVGVCGAAGAGGAGFDRPALVVVCGDVGPLAVEPECVPWVCDDDPPPVERGGGVR
jgi:hypothetical protein